MMRRLSPVCLAFAYAATFFTDAPGLQAQGPGFGTQFQDPGSFRRVASDVNVGLPGRVWLETNLTDRGLGFQGSYFTLGAKNRLFQDSLDGRWLGEARVHHSLEEGGGFFTNIGIERVFSIDAAKADVVTGFWYDFDGDEQGVFSNSFSQVGVHAGIKTKKWDLLGNGYFPVGVTDYTTAGPSGNNVFLGNNILLIPGVDSALQGFDVTFRMRPRQLAFGNGLIDFGGYSYSSDLINSFGGGRVRLGFQTNRGMMISAEVNHDDRFETTGALSLSWAFGAGGVGGDAGYGLGRDLEETVRQDHIVRFNQEFELAIDPSTGLPYNVVHVSNAADAAFEEGTFENPFASLASAEANSQAGDTIFVAQGNGGTQGLDTGIVLKDNQKLFGGGGDIIIPIQDGRRFLLPTEGGRPTISNPGGDNVVEIANNNQIRNIAIDATGANNGIFGELAVNGEITDTVVTGAGENGVRLERIRGDWNIQRNNFSDNTIDGFFVDGALTARSVFNFEDNVANNNGFDGLHLEGFRASQVQFLSNVTNANARHGLFVDDFIGVGLDMDVIAHTSTANGANGIYIDGGDGDLNVVNTNSTNNAGDGLNISNWSTSQTEDNTFVGVTPGGVSNLNGNGIGGGANLAIVLNQNNRQQRVTVTDQALDNGGRGFVAEASGIGTQMDLAFVNNDSVSGNSADGIRLSANNSGVLNVLIENDAATPLIMNDNAQIAGAGISLIADGPLGNASSQINAVVRNVNIDNGSVGFITDVALPLNGIGVNVSGVNSSRINLLMEDSTVRSALGFNVAFDNNDNMRTNNVFLRNLTVRTDSGFFVDTQPGTMLDFLLTDSDIQSNGTLTQPGDPAPDIGVVIPPFTDALGDVAFVLNAVGDPSTAALDNLTRIQLTNNLIRDWTFDAISLNTDGDAQLLAYVISNEILSNGPGIDNDPNNDNIPEVGDSGAVIPSPGELNFHDGLEINAFGTSTISARIEGNNFVNNYELGLNINTFDSGTINASINNNAFANDIGEDSNNVITGTAIPIIDNSEFDFSAFNGNQGSMNLALSSNVFKLDALFNQASTNGFNLELDGSSNGFTDTSLFISPGINTTSVGLTEQLISDEELFFIAAGFVEPSTPAGGSFQGLDHE